MKQKNTNIWFKLFYQPKLLFNDGTRLYLIFQTLYCTLKRLGDTEKIVSTKSKVLLAEKLTTSTTTDNSLSPSIKWNEKIKFLFSI